MRGFKVSWVWSAGIEVGGVEGAAFNLQTINRMSGRRLQQPF